MTQMILMRINHLKLSFLSHLNHCSTNLHTFTQASVVRSLIGNVWVCVTIFSESRPDWAWVHDGMSRCLLAGTVAGFWHKVARAVHLTLPLRQRLRKRQGDKKKREKDKMLCHGVTNLTEETQTFKTVCVWCSVWELWGHLPLRWLCQQVESVCVCARVCIFFPFVIIRKGDFKQMHYLYHFLKH